MKNRIIILLTILCLSKHLFSQKEESAIKSFSSCVAFLNDTRVETIKVNNKVLEIWLKEPGSNLGIPKTYRITGTGFFVSDTLISLYLVTAEHVAKDMTLYSDVVMHGENDTPLVYKLKDLVLRKDTLTWTYNKSADVATLLLDNNSKAFENPYISFIPITMIESNRIPIRERDVTTIGFPLDLGYQDYFSPISKISKPSSGLIEFPRFDNHKSTSFFLLDDPSISGFSGSPVFELPTHLVLGESQVFVNAYKLIGLVHGSLSDKTGGGFSAIVPSKYILETLKVSPKYSGVFRWYHENKKLWSERIYKDGRPWTVLNNFDRNGKPMEKGTLKDGKGSLYIYDNDGKIISIEHYENGLTIAKDKNNKN